MINTTQYITALYAIITVDAAGITIKSFYHVIVMSKKITFSTFFLLSRNLDEFNYQFKWIVDLDIKQFKENNVPTWLNLQVTTTFDCPYAEITLKVKWIEN